MNFWHGQGRTGLNGYDARTACFMEMSLWLVVSTIFKVKDERLGGGGIGLAVLNSKRRFHTHIWLLGCLTEEYGIRWLRGGVRHLE